MSVCVAGLTAQEVTLISGVWERGNPDIAGLYKVADGALHDVAFSKIDGNHRFVFALNQEEEGFYAIALNSTSTQHRYLFYLKPGDRLNLRITEESYELTGDNTPENLAMAQWHDFVLPLERKSVYFQRQNSTYVDFFPLLDEKLEAMKSLPEANTPNSAFNAAFEEYKRNDFLFIAINFIQTPRSAHPAGEDFGDYYRNIDLPSLTRHCALLDYPDGLSLIMSCYLSKKRIINAPADRGEMRYASLMEELLVGSDAAQIANDTIRGELALMLARGVKTAQHFETFLEKYGHCIVTGSQQERLKETGLSLHRNEAGEKAPDFTFPDVNGKEFSLSSFKGKVVYLDIWATWCGWCRGEIPHLKKLEEEYKERIVFIGISIDDAKDIEKWKKFLTAEQLGGLQLFAGDRATESLKKPYRIEGIPRFILVGKDGRLVSGDAPRPSSDEIRPMLDSALKK
jgi:thiol-disulfide isomerase/thioredoxin